MLLITQFSNTSHSESETGEGSNIEAGVELQEMPEVTWTCHFRSKHGYPTTNDCNVGCSKRIIGHTRRLNSWTIE